MSGCYLLATTNNSNYWDKHPFNTPFSLASDVFGPLIRTMKWLSIGGSSAHAESGKMDDEARILIRAGDVEIDLSLIHI